MEAKDGYTLCFYTWVYDHGNLISKIKEFEGSILDRKITNFVRF